MTQPGRGREPRARSAGAFTLVELLVVVAIIALLVSLLLPVLSRAKELTRRAICASQLRGIGSGWQIYWAQSNNRFPPMHSRENQSPYYFVVYYNTTLASCGYLYKTGVLKDEKLMYGCPTYTANSGTSHWFAGVTVNTALAQAAAGQTGIYSRMTWSGRRMKYYNDQALTLSADTTKDPLQLRNSTTESVLRSDVTVAGQPKVAIQSGSCFSLMTDRISCGNDARFSHVPGVNVLYLDNHVAYFQDATPDGSILYNNPIIDDWVTGADNWSSQIANWTYDNIFVTFDKAAGFGPPQ